MREKISMEETAAKTEEAAETAIESGETEEKERVETPYDNIIEDLYPHREPLERAVSFVKKAAVIAGIVIFGMYTMKVGDTAQLSQKQQRAVGGYDDVEEYSGKQKKERKSGGRMLNISVVDELPPESELEIYIIGQDDSTYDAYEVGSDNIFSQRASLIDTEHGTIRLLQEDGSIGEDEGMKVEMNTVKFFVPEGGSRTFGIPNFSTTIFGEGEWEKMQEMSKRQVAGEECDEFNAGIDHARQLVKEGYLNDEISDLLAGFPEIAPFEREYTLKLTYAGETFREDDATRWWDVDYNLYTTADNGEVIMLLKVEIWDVTLAMGMPEDLDDAHYRLWAYTDSLWRLIEDPVKDRGRVMLQQVLGDSFANEESVRKFVKDRGVSFFLPEGADTKVMWNCRRQEGFYYDYLVWEGETQDYEVTLAIPLMDKQDEGYLLASYIRREAEDKETCRYILSGMMQTLRGSSYLHVVKEGESLCKIAEKYLGSQGMYIWIWLYNEADDTKEDFADPDLIYPGQKVYVKLDYRRTTFEYDAETARKYIMQSSE